MANNRSAAHSSIALPPIKLAESGKGQKQHCAEHIDACGATLAFNTYSYATRLGSSTSLYASPLRGPTERGSDLCRQG